MKHEALRSELLSVLVDDDFFLFELLAMKSLAGIDERERIHRVSAELLQLVRDGLAMVHMRRGLEAPNEPISLEESDAILRDPRRWSSDMRNTGYVNATATAKGVEAYQRSDA
jgi:hypothetical protein